MDNTIFSLAKASHNQIILISIHSFIIFFNINGFFSLDWSLSATRSINVKYGILIHLRDEVSASVIDTDQWHYSYNNDTLFKHTLY